jgi:hypothetical protein
MRFSFVHTLAPPRPSAAAGVPATANFVGQVTRLVRKFFLRHASSRSSRCPPPRVRDLALPLGELLGFVGQRTHRTFERGALQHLDALLELLAQALLLLRQVGHRARVFRQLLRSLLELAQLLSQLGVSALRNFCAS